MNEEKPNEAKARADYRSDDHLTNCVVEQINASDTDEHGHEA